MNKIPRYHFLNEVKSMISENPKCMEIGVDTGNFSEVIFREFNPSRLVLIDPFTEGVDPITKNDRYPNKEGGFYTQRTVYSNEAGLNSVKSKLSGAIESGIVEIERGFSTEVLHKFEDDEFDFIYVDACHIYEAVLWDLENYINKLKPGGMMAGHDYGATEYGVTEAVHDFCKKYNYEIIMLSTEGDFALSLKK